MDLTVEIGAAVSHPEKLEHLYQDAIRQKDVTAFQTAVFACYEETPENLLLAAWYYRLQAEEPTQAMSGNAGNWLVAVPLSILTGLIFWALSDFEKLTVLDTIPHLLLWWAPIATMSALVFLAVTSSRHYPRAVALGLGPLVVVAYVLLLAPILDPPWLSEQYLVIAAIHLPLLCWAGIGIYVLGMKSFKEDRFAFLKKSVEVMIVAGLYVIFGAIFGGITIGLFEALNLALPEVWLRLIGAGGFGLLPVLAVATIYDPKKSPAGQDFDQGLSNFVATMMRLLLPLTLAVLLVYLVVIPFNYREPYENRSLLIVYNLLLFGIMGLLLGATPISGSDLSPKVGQWLRNGIIAVSIVTVLISIYALSATVYRTIEGGLTLNRITIIGWNSINISLLGLLIFRQFRDGRDRWIESLHSLFGLATNAYLIWGLLLLLAIPYLLLLLI